MQVWVIINILSKSLSRRHNNSPDKRLVLWVTRFKTYCYSRGLAVFQSKTSPSFTCACVNEAELRLLQKRPVAGLCCLGAACVCELFFSTRCRPIGSKRCRWARRIIRVSIFTAPGSVTVGKKYNTRISHSAWKKFPDLSFSQKNDCLLFPGSVKQGMSFKMV